MQIRKYWMVYLAFVLLVIVAIGQHIASGSPHYIPPVKYGQQWTFYFNVFDSNSPWAFYATAPVSADVHIIKDGGTAANPTNSITDLGKTFSLVLTATEMSAAVVIVEMNDISSPKLYMDDSWAIPTYGNASALGAFDLDDAIPPSDVQAIDGNEAGATGLAQVYESDFATDFNDTSKMWNVDTYYIRGEEPGDYDAIVEANENQTAAAAAIQANVTTIEGYVDDIGVAGLGLAAVPWNPVWDANIQKEAADAITAAALATAANLVTLQTTVGEANDNTQALLEGTLSANLVEIDGNDLSGYGATLRLKQLGISNPSGVGVAITGSTIGMTVTGTAGDAIQATVGSGNNDALQLTASGSGSGLKVSSAGSGGDGVSITAADDGIGISTSGDGVVIAGNTYGLYISSSTTTAMKLQAATAAGSGDGLEVVGAGTGKGIDAIELAALQTTANGIDANMEDNNAVLLSTILTRAMTGDSMRIVDGVGVGEINTYEGAIVTVTGLDAVLSDTNELQSRAAWAPASTALSSATWTNTKAGYLDQAISDVNGSGGGTTYLLNTTVAAATNARIFTLAAGSANNDAWLYHTITLVDANDPNNPEERVIIAYIGATRQVTVDRNFSFTPTVGDVARIPEGGYAWTKRFWK